MNSNDLKIISKGIQDKTSQDQFEFSKHAVDQSILRRILVQEIKEAIANAQLIENYPDDKYGPSCLLCGVTQAGRPIHVQCSYPNRSLVKIIIVYEPDPTKWANDFTIRRINHDD